MRQVFLLSYTCVEVLTVCVLYTVHPAKRKEKSPQHGLIRDQHTVHIFAYAHILSHQMHLFLNDDEEEGKKEKTREKQKRNKEGKKEGKLERNGDNGYNIGNAIRMKIRI